MNLNVLEVSEFLKVKAQAIEGKSQEFEFLIPRPNDQLRLTIAIERSMVDLDIGPKPDGHFYASFFCPSIRINNDSPRKIASRVEMSVGASSLRVLFIPHTWPTDL